MFYDSKNYFYCPCVLRERYDYVYVFIYPSIYNFKVCNVNNVVTG